MASTIVHCVNHMRMFYQDGYIVPLKLYMIGMDNKLRFLKEFGS